MRESVHIYKTEKQKAYGGRERVLCIFEKKKKATVCIALVAFTERAVSSLLVSMAPEKGNAIHLPGKRFYKPP